MAEMIPVIATPTSAAVVFYHYPCPDGIFAAWAAHMGLQRAGRTGTP